MTEAGPRVVEPTARVFTSDLPSARDPYSSSSAHQVMGYAHDLMTRSIRHQLQLVTTGAMARNGGRRRRPNSRGPLLTISP